MGTHTNCVYFVWERSTRQAALEGTACPDCESLTIRVLRPRLAICNEDGQAHEPCGVGPASINIEAARRCSSRGSQMKETACAIGRCMAAMVVSERQS